MATPYKLGRLLLLLVAMPVVAAAQGAASIHGAVTTLGPDGVPVEVPGVQIILRCQKASDNRKTAPTDESGRFWLWGVAPGKCAVTAAARGFRNETKSVEVTENSVVELSFQLSLVPVAERNTRPSDTNAPKQPKKRSGAAD